ncbi:MAG: signal peptidase I [Kiritimatiellae bacterium]|nr:signal peptidase I [Kiritimatiellia bacterium]
MNALMTFFKNRKIRKQLKSLLHSARTLRASREDILKEGDLRELTLCIDSAAAAYKSGDAETMEREGTKLDECISAVFPPEPYAAIRENFDVLVVAIGVAMAFRAYFYQPFKIPTGSMQPTLYGIHSEPAIPENRTLLDRQPLKFFKWLVTGDSFTVVKAKAAGTVKISPHCDKPGYIAVVIGGVPHYIPSDVAGQNPNTFEHMLYNGLQDGDTVRKGDVLWCGIIHSGDFVFVNRWIWNFRHPRRGDVMVFLTTGINNLTQGTHYIKRMMGLPGETLQIKPPYLYADGKRIDGPGRITQIAMKQSPRENAPAYAGFNPAPFSKRCHPQGLDSEDATITLTPTQFYAMGDNSFNSYDSRYWGPVPEENLLGPATFVYWPFTSPRAGFIH